MTAGIQQTPTVWDVRRHIRGIIWYGCLISRYGAPWVHYSPWWRDEPLRISPVSVLLLLCKTLKTGPVCAMPAWIHTLAAWTQAAENTLSASNTHSLIDCQGNVFSLCPQTFTFLRNKRLDVCLSWCSMCVKEHTPYLFFIHCPSGILLVV